MERNDKIVIRMENIQKSVQVGKNKLEILKGIDLEIQEGEMLAIMGASGCGKSTLLNVIGCLDVPTVGNYWLKGEKVNTKLQKQLAKIRNETFGYVIQDFALILDATVWENVTIPLDYSKKKVKKDEVLKLLKAFGLENLKKTKASLLSGGEQQRVAIARALVNRPDIILADEPTGALDSKTGKIVMGILRQICDSGKTVLVVTHDKEVAKKCDRTLFMKDGVVFSSVNLNNMLDNVKKE